MDFSKLFGKLDPTGLALAGMSLFGGGDDGQQKRKSFGGTGLTDPRNSLYQALAAINRLGQGLAERRPTRLRSSYVQKGPEPVSIPGLPFQIGGGLGTDPALADPSLLDVDRSAGQKYDPFQSVAQGQFNPTPSSPFNAQTATPTRRRDPNA